ncbi:SixA phosphatase family protein [Noviherbaspirillum galbum]|uniref:Histidine phosphatase family protein n=1 Tax=Noviherbaspirillum galbum TaxID=2709383 RepID=A0A6B3SMX7_9BURK|nr:histidine phosphatase family protein [Noviherbaspirillum galbum]NEX62230.1 histidine phosphatase family protein [Noviherbaspirillum galbum]
MELILWRHADAAPGEDDAARPLTAKGVKQAAKMGKWLDRHLPGSCRILASPAVRCVSTAEALGRKFKTHAALSVDSTPEQIIAAINWPDSRETVMIVGHQPLLGELMAMLLFGEKKDLEIRKAHAAWLAHDAEHKVYVKAWMGPGFTK